MEAIDYNKTRTQYRAREGIEPIIVHLKQDHRMGRNYLLDEQGDKVNILIVATGFNLRKMLKRIKIETKNIFELILKYIFKFK